MAVTSASMWSFMHCLVTGFLICNLLSTPCHANREVDALIDMKNMLHDPKNVLQSWDPNTVDSCTWLHVTCDKNGRVIRLDLSFNDLSGSLTPRIGDLANLQFLHLFNNSLSGSLPTSLGKLKNLIALRLSSNKFTGKIPTSLTRLSKLRFLDLCRNQLSGPVPTGGSLTRFGYESFKENPGLCGSVVQKPCGKNASQSSRNVRGMNILLIYVAFYQIITK